MTIATWILFFLGVLGALDIALFHTIAHGIRRHLDCRTELLVHALRGPTYAALFLVVPNLELRGAFFWALLALLAFDLAISLWDFAIERRSRESLGGLPTGEYVLHVLIAMLFGALVLAVVLEAGGGADAPSAAAYRPALVPDALRIVLAVMAGMVLWSGIADARAWRALRDITPDRRSRSRGRSTQPANPAGSS